LSVAPDKYQSILTSEQSSKGNQLILMDLEIIICQHWRQINHKELVKRLMMEKNCIQHLMASTFTVESMATAQISAQKDQTAKVMHLKERRPLKSA
jgi:hypothetical protein